jgi:hypothetical protein
MDLFRKIGDFVQRIQAILWAFTIIWALGFGAIAVGVINAVFEGVPRSSLILLGIGIALLSLPFGYFAIVWLRSRGTATAEPTHETPAAELEEDPDYHQMLAQLHETELAEIKAERDDVKQRLISVEEDSFKYLKLSLHQGTEIVASERKVKWADGLIQRERGFPSFENPIVNCGIGRRHHLAGC